MDELKQIRLALEAQRGTLDAVADEKNPMTRNYQANSEALEALARLEAREAEMAVAPTQTKEELQAAARDYCDGFDLAKIVDRIREQATPGTEGRGGWGYNLMDIECEALIGQYAYRYSEDIRKERDEWKALAEKFRDAVNEMGAE